MKRLRGKDDGGQRFCEALGCDRKAVGLARIPVGHVEDKPEYRLMVNHRTTPACAWLCSVHWAGDFPAALKTCEEVDVNESI